MQVRVLYLPADPRKLSGFFIFHGPHLFLHQLPVLSTPFPFSQTFIGELFIRKLSSVNLQGIFSVFFPGGRNLAFFKKFPYLIKSTAWGFFNHLWKRTSLAIFPISEPITSDGELSVWENQLLFQLPIQFQVFPDCSESPFENRSLFCLGRKTKSFVKDLGRSCVRLYSSWGSQGVFRFLSAFQEAF